MKISKFVREYKTVIENYIFMTTLQFVNSFFYLAIYPFLIGKIGAHNYGSYVFCYSIITFGIFFINFGFDLPAIKKISQNKENNNEKEKLFSTIFYSKLILLLLFSIFLFVITCLFENIYIYKSLILIVYIQAIATVFLPMWYFQGIEAMRGVTLIQVIIKIASLPFIFYLIKDENDIDIFALIVSLNSLLIGVLAFIWIIVKEKLKLRLISNKRIKNIFIESTPFFLNSVTSIVKDQSIVIVMGLYFGMKEVAIYDLAMKVVSIPRTIVISLNAAIFPKLINNLSVIKLKKLIKFEYLLSVIIIFFVIAFGRFAINFLSNGTLMEAYYVSVFLSLTILSWLIVGCFINFIFIPTGNTNLIVKNQIYALFSLIIFILLGLLFNKSIYVISSAVVFSAIIEILYCYFVTNKYKLFKSNVFKS